MNKLLRQMCLLLLVVALPATAIANTAIDGVWQHSQKPAWLNFQFDDGIGIARVFRHDNNEKAKGLMVLKSIEEIEGFATKWSGKMYAAHLNDFIDAELNLIQPNQLEITIKNGSESEILLLIRE